MIECQLSRRYILNTHAPINTGSKYIKITNKNRKAHNLDGIFKCTFLSN